MAKAQASTASVTEPEVQPATETDAVTTATASDETAKPVKVRVPEGMGPEITLTIEGAYRVTYGVEGDTITVGPDDPHETGRTPLETVLRAIPGARLAEEG